MTTRELISEAPDGSRVVLHQRLLPSGEWHNQSATEMPAAETPKAVSGSSSDHARLSASGSKTWLNCKRAPSFVDENEDRIFEMAVQSVIRLTPYLKSIPDELYPHEGMAMRWARDVAEGRVKAKDLTPAQKKDIWRTEGSEYSREGTRAHDFATSIFLGEKTVEDIPESFRQPVGFYVDFCKSFLLTPDEPFFTETRVPYFYDPKEAGTVDFRIVRDDRITIIDLKYGQGDLVDAVENSQCAIYALSVIEDLEASGMYSFDPDTIVDIWIVQPRHHADKPAKQWELTLAELRAFQAAIQATHDEIVAGGDLEFAPSKDACKWCSAKSFCPARAEDNTSFLAGPGYSGIDLLAGLPDIDEIEGTTTKKEFNSRPPEEKVNLRLGDKAPLDFDIQVQVKMNKAAMIEWINDVCENVDDQVLGGRKHPLLKIVAGNPGDREWIDESAADKMLGNRLKTDERYVKKLISPAKAEKLIDFKKETTRFKGLWEKAIRRATGRNVVVPATDKRDPVAALVDDLPDIEDAFEFPEGM